MTFISFSATWKTEHSIFDRWNWKEKGPEWSKRVSGRNNWRDKCSKAIREWTIRWSRKWCENINWKRTIWKISRVDCGVIEQLIYSIILCVLLLNKDLNKEGQRNVKKENINIVIMYVWQVEYERIFFTFLIWRPSLSKLFFRRNFACLFF